MSTPPPPDYDHPFEVKKRRRRWIALGVVLILLAGGLAGRTIYRRVKPDNLAAAARTELEAGRFAEASLLARRALDIDPYHVPANDVLADMADTLRAPSALTWRRRLADLDDGNPRRQIDLAEAALRAQQPDLARLALGRVPASGRETAPYQASSAALAMATSQTESARLHIAAACRLEPGNARYRFLEAVLQLPSSAPKDVAARREVFLKSLAEPALREDAMRALWRDGEETGDYSAVLAAATDLTKKGDVSWATKLLYLQALEATQDAGAVDYLARLSEEAQGDPVQFTALAGWLNSRQRPADTIRLAAALDKEVRQSLPAGPALAAAFSQTEDWAALSELLEASRWEPLEPIRLAELAHAQRQQNDPQWSLNWSSAVSRAANQDPLRQRLYQLAQSWQWDDELPALLQKMTESPRLGDWALRELYRYYRGKKDAASLFRIVSQLYRRSPGDPRIQNNFAMLSLLLDRDRPAATALAKRQFDAAPLEPNVASTYAFALLRNGQAARALAIMNELSADQLAQPDVALYYGLVLRANGQSALAEKYFERTDSNELLSEEKRLIEQVKKTGQPPGGHD